MTSTVQPTRTHPPKATETVIGEGTWADVVRSIAHDYEIAGRLSTDQVERILADHTPWRTQPTLPAIEVALHRHFVDLEADQVTNARSSAQP